ncbi:MAG TPA: DUF4810 domain-containing protein [Verrucomicrobiae bacterium]|jgi:hypothetical protein|nr:DUF4810 domain-containing protein [Verrucomicrobiae bacterium]
MRELRVAFAVAALFVLSACVKQPLYAWGRYEDLVYQMYMKPGEADPVTQTAKLNEDIQKANAEGKPVPPGLHAHLAYLYYQQGDLGAARQEFQIEKKLFPESAAFIDGVLQRMDRKAGEG